MNLSYLETFLEAAKIISLVCRKSGDSEETIASYQNWDEIANRLKHVTCEKDLFDDIIAYKLDGIITDNIKQLIDNKLI